MSATDPTGRGEPVTGSPRDPRISEDEAAFIERIAEAVVRRLDEREKIRLLADAVLERMREIEQVAISSQAERNAEEHLKEGHGKEE